MGRFDGARGVGRGRGRSGAGPHGRGARSGGRGPGGRGPYPGAGADKDLALLPFLQPTPRALAPVPLVFESALQFCHLIGNNLLAEFWHLVQEGPRGPAIRAQPAGEGKLSLVPDAGSEGGESLVHHLLLINRNSLHLVVAQSGGNLRDAATGERAPIVLSLKPKLTGFQGPIRSFGYVGSFVAELAALQELAARDCAGAAHSPVLRAVLDPRVDVPGHWHPPPLPEEDFELLANKNKLRGGGGTSSTTGVTDARREEEETEEEEEQDAEEADEAADASASASASAGAREVPLETTSTPPKKHPPTDKDKKTRPPPKRPPANASQKAAVIALTHALEKIQGPPGTGKSTTIYHVVTQRVPPGSRVLVTCSRNVAIESIAQKLEACDQEILVVGAPGRIGAAARRHLLDTKTEAHPRVRAAASREPAGFQSQAALDAARDVRGPLMEKCQLILCTIASTSRLLREWEEFVAKPLLVHTVIVDECGCTPESSTALLLNLRPRNMVLLGDHKQLPPCSLVPPQTLRNTGHDRSMLERCVTASGGRVHRLTEQYRMHPRVCETVSGRFYDGALTTAPSVAASRIEDAEARGERDAMVWVRVPGGREEVPEDGKSFVNRAEVEAVVAAATRTRARRGFACSVAALTFYKGQYVALLEAMPASLKVEVLTVDACQGSEFDYVFVSTVRANASRAIGFVSDPRRINVAVSRARKMCVVFGCDATMAGKPGTDWWAIKKMCVLETYGGGAGTGKATKGGDDAGEDAEEVGSEEDACRWRAPPPEPGFTSMLQHKKIVAKEPVAAEQKREEEETGTNVGAAAFVPKSLLEKEKEGGFGAGKKKKGKKKNKGPGASSLFPGEGRAPPAVPGSASLPTRTGPMVPRKLAMRSMPAATATVASFAPGLVDGGSVVGSPGPRFPPNGGSFPGPRFPNGGGFSPGGPPLPPSPPPPPAGAPPFGLHPGAGGVAGGAGAPAFFGNRPRPPPPPFSFAAVPRSGGGPRAPPPPRDGSGTAVPPSMEDSDWEPPSGRVASHLNLSDLDAFARADSPPARTVPPPFAFGTSRAGSPGGAGGGGERGRGESRSRASRR